MMISDLVPELESEILSRVPATSLVQLRFTCKRWYGLTKDPRFIKKNMEEGKASATQMVLKKNKWVYSFSIDLNRIHNRFDQFIQFTGKIRSLKDSEDVKISKIFHCEGLLLCKTKDKRLVVWNPCTRQTRWIKTKESSLCYYLGYEKNNKSCHRYKILSLDCYRNDQNATIPEFEMYEFESDSWRVLVTRNKWDFFGGGVSLQGDTYWLASEEEKDTVDNFLQRFDFTTERFERLALPFESDDEYDLASVLSVFREEKLAVSYQDLYQTDPIMKIWMTNNIKTDEFSWSLFLVVDFSKHMIDDMTRLRSFLVDEENKRVMCCDVELEIVRNNIYIVGEDIHKEIYRDRTNETKFGNQLLLSYVPSLVQIPANQNNSAGKRKRQGQEDITLTKSK